MLYTKTHLFSVEFGDIEENVKHDRVPILSVVFVLNLVVVFERFVINSVMRLDEKNR